MESMEVTIYLLFIEYYVHKVKKGKVMKNSRTDSQIKKSA